MDGDNIHSTIGILRSRWKLNSSEAEFPAQSIRLILIKYSPSEILFKSTSTGIFLVLSKPERLVTKIPGITSFDIQTSIPLSIIEDFLVMFRHHSFTSTDIFNPKVELVMLSVL